MTENSENQDLQNRNFQNQGLSNQETTNPSGANQPAANCSGTNYSVMDAERTLQLVAALPPPAGLPERVHARLAEGRLTLHREASVRSSFWSYLGFAGTGHPARRLQFAGAALLAVIAAGSVWSVYSGGRGTVSSSAHPAALPPSGNRAPGGGFGSAGAVRVPPTLAPIHVGKVPDAVSSADRKKPSAKHVAGKLGPRAAVSPAAPPDADSATHP